MSSGKSKTICAILFLCLAFGAMAQGTKDGNPISLRGILVWREAQRIEAKAAANMETGIVELLATTPGGKEHESVFVAKCNPALLHSALLLIGVRPAASEGGTDSPGIGGDRLHIYVRWKEDGKERCERAECFLWDQKNRRAMSPTTWAFTGSRLVRDPRIGREIFQANASGALVATYYDPDAVLNNPLPERNDDTVYCVNPETALPRGTEAILVFSPRPIEQSGEIE